MRKLIDKTLANTLVVLMGILVIDVLWQVISRYIMSSPSMFTDELAGFLLIWVGLLGAAYVAGLNEHLAIDILLQRLSPSKKYKLQLFIFALIFIFAIAVLVVGGIWLVYTRFYLNVTSAALQVNLGYVYLVLPLSGVLTAYYTVDNAIKLTQSYKQSSDN
ncbi:MAG: TRAP transporter small permease [Tannerellaceae bacterium]|nr:TRAP transporter small permease [Tannerellaceae bacterium]